MSQKPGMLGYMRTREGVGIAVYNPVYLTPDADSVHIPCSLRIHVEEFLPPALCLSYVGINMVFKMP